MSLALTFADVSCGAALAAPGAPFVSCVTVTTLFADIALCPATPFNTPCITTAIAFALSVPFACNCIGTFVPVAAAFVKNSYFEVTPSSAKSNVCPLTSVPVSVDPTVNAIFVAVELSAPFLITSSRPASCVVPVTVKERLAAVASSGPNLIFKVLS